MDCYSHFCYICGYNRPNLEQHVACLAQHASAHSQDEGAHQRIQEGRGLSTRRGGGHNRCCGRRGLLLRRGRLLHLQAGG